MERAGDLDRRTLLSGAAAGAVGLWLPGSRVERSAAAACSVPPRFPSGIPLFRQAYENWATAIAIDEIWTCAPASPEDAARVVNWAHRHGYRVRARGAMHNWSPLAVTADESCATKVVLLDTTAGLCGLALESERPAAVRVGAGETVEAMLGFCERHGFGMTPVPAPGNVTVGGLMAIGGHGASLPVRGEETTDHAYGSMVNLVESFTAVVWSKSRKRYVLRRFDRDHPDAKALLVHLGRMLVTSYTLRVAPNRNLRCVSRTDIPASTLFGADGAAAESVASLVEHAGRIETIHFPFTSNPWVKVWSVAPEKPPGSRAVDGPNNYPFSDNIPREVTDLADAVIRGRVEATPLLGQAGYGVSVAGLAATNSADIWGPSKNTQIFIKPTTLRVDGLSFAVATKRKHIQRVVSTFYRFYEERIEDYRRRGAFPVNGPVEIRVTGLDHTGRLRIPGAEPPILSAATVRPGRRWDVAVWLAALTFPHTPEEFRFFRDLERFITRTFRGWAEVRPEWSKLWATTDSAAWSNRNALQNWIPAQLSRGRSRSADFEWARRRLNRYDPHRIFSTRLLDRLLP